MKCAFDYCVYNRDSLCILESIQIDSLGMCEECIVVSLEANLLDALKKRQLQETPATPASKDSFLI